MAHLLGMSGSLRKGSYNTMLVREAARLFEPSEFTLADLDLPLFNEDVEAEGWPAPVEMLFEQIRRADAIVIGCPEYNKAFSGVLKNALDWISRPRPALMAEKPLALMSATAGPAGGERSKSAAYLTLIPFKARLILHPEINIGGASDQFDAEGRLVNEAKARALGKLMGALREAV